MHRNVIFRGDTVPALPVSYYEQPTSEGLRSALESGCIDGLPGCDVLAIPHNSNLSNGGAEAANRLAKAAAGNPQKAIEDIFLTVLSRRPFPAEAQKMADFVARHGESKGYAGVFWALLNSAEFVSNH